MSSYRTELDILRAVKDKRAVVKDKNVVFTEIDFCNGHVLIIEDFYLNVEKSDFGKKYGLDCDEFSLNYNQNEDGSFYIDEYGEAFGFKYTQSYKFENAEELIDYIILRTDRALNQKNKDIGFEGQPMIQQMVYLGEWS